jgi:threonine synthase
MAGFFIALKKNLINDGETVLVNIGEGANRAPYFLEQMIYTSRNVKKVEEWMTYRAQLWNEVLTRLAR